jgi:hypothetical protein
MSQNAHCKWIPHDDVTFLTARGDKLVLLAVHKAVDTLLVKVERLVLKLKFVDVVDVNQTVERGTEHIIQIGVVLDLGDPALVDVPTLHVYTPLVDLSFKRLLLRG